jgi:predicted nucleic acid-binding protein
LISYCETSFLVSLYTPDANSVKAASYIAKAGGPFPLTPFGEAELANAMELRVFRREVTSGEAKTALATLASHIASGVFYTAPMPAAVYDMSMRLSRKHTATLGTRTLDILHVASALALKAERFYTFDRRQAQLARLAGLKTPVPIP